MSAFLLTWNPDKWHWTYLARQLRQLVRAGFVEEPWSCSNRKQLPVGSRIYLMRLGGGLDAEKKGIVGLGSSISNVYEEAHWDAELAAGGAITHYVRVRFSALTRDPIISLDELVHRFPAFDWTPQNSGVVIPDKIAAGLAELIEAVSGGTRHPDELDESGSYPEGSVRGALVNAYERSAAARAACLAHHGYGCVVCGRTMEDMYGRIAAGFIHVHHVRPLATLKATYVVNPIDDLCPVCPNCHAALHMRTPPYSPMELRGIMAAAKASMSVPV